MWEDIKRVVRNEYKDGHLSTKMRQERFKSKLGPTFVSYYILSKLDRNINSRDGRMFCDKLRILCNQLFDEDKRRTRDEIYRMLLKNVYAKQIAGHGKETTHYEKLVTLTLTHRRHFF